MRACVRACVRAHVPVKGARHNEVVIRAELVQALVERTVVYQPASLIDDDKSKDSPTRCKQRSDSGPGNRAGDTHLGRRTVIMPGLAATQSSPGQRPRGWRIGGGSTWTSTFCNEVKDTGEMGRAK